MADTPAKPRRRWFSYRLRTLFVGMTVLGCSAGAWLVRDYMPGTIRRTEQGVVRGTGTLRSYYPSGSLKAEECYRNGLLLRQTWYRPDGSVFVTSDFDKKTGGWAHILRDDGTLMCRFHCKYKEDQFGIAYAADGPVAH